MKIHRYILLSIFTIIVAFYILFTEIVVRGELLVQDFGQMLQKQRALLTPEEFSMRKRELQTEKKELSLWAKHNYSSTQQNESGLFEYLNSNAKQNNVIVRSINPSEARSYGSGKEILFTMSLSAKFHDVAKFINSIETGAIPIIIVKSNLQSEPIGNTTIDVSIEGQSRLLSTYQ